MKIVVIIVGIGMGILLLMFIAACAAVVKAGECMQDMERLICGDFRS